ncbi:hypothetical protein UlMin_037966 [Ulmus minor]
MSASLSMVETVWKEIESTGFMTDEELSILHFLFGKNFERATRIMDQRGIKRKPNIALCGSLVVGGSRRKEEYACFPENLCACYSFFYDIVNRGDQVCVKEEAQQLALIFDTIGTFKVKRKGGKGKLILGR